MNKTQQIFITETQPSTSSQRHIEIPPTPQVNLENVEDFSNVCRICATVTEFVVPIFSGEGLQNNLAEKIRKHLPIQVSEQDVLPRVVCYQCASTILAWHELVMCSEQADEALKTKILVTGNSEVADSDKNMNFKTESTENQQDNNGDMSTVGSEGEAEAARPGPVVVGEDGRRYRACARCSRHVPLALWRRHERAHRGERAFRCDACGAGFCDRSNLARHALALHAGRRPHRCPACPEAFTRRGHLEDHVRTHSPTRGFVCDECGRGYKSAAGLRVHKKAHDRPRFDCLECGGRFKRMGELKSHMSVHTGERAHACECGRSFRLRSQLNASGTGPARATSPRDEGRAGGPESRPRPLCPEGDAYVEEKDRSPHLAPHPTADPAGLPGYREGGAGDDEESTPPRPATELGETEDDDGPADARASEADEHREDEFSDHSDTGYFGTLPESVFEAIEDTRDGPPTEADAPGDRAPRVDGADAAEGPRDSPEKKSAPKKIRTCPVCSKTYTAASSYFYHMRHRHGPGGSHECDVCGRKFGTRAGLAQHAPVHTGERRYACEQCDKRFGSRASLYIHAQVHAAGGGRRWTCAQCGAGFRWRAQLQRHARRHGAARRHACGACGRGFHVRGDLLRHARTHRAGAHACPHCAQLFAQLRYLKVHVANKHGKES